MSVSRFFSPLLILALGALPAFADDEAIAASNNPKEAELRSKIVDYMRAAANVEWTPKEDIEYWNGSGFVFKKGETYYGLPYTQFQRNHNLASFETQIETIDGQRVYVGPTNREGYFGSDCSASVSNAWRQVDPDLPALLTRRMIPDRPKEVVPVGDYPLNFYDSTPNIVKEAGYETMKAAYAQLKPADAVVMHVNYDGHVMLILKNDPENERVFVSDQTGLANGKPKGKDGRSTFRVDCEYTYKRLFDNGYIPIALKVVDDAANEKYLFNGENLDGWRVFLKKSGTDDPDGVFSVKDGVLRLGGEDWGGLSTLETFENYRLTVEFKWGDKATPADRRGARDSGVMIHATGPDNGFAGLWARSIQANLVEGGIGDICVVAQPEDGLEATGDVVKRPGGRVFDPKNGKPETIRANSDGVIQWLGRSPNWKNERDFRGPLDVDRPGDWNELVIYAVGDKMEVYLNGKFVNRAYNLKPTSGRIQLQSEGFEIFFRRVSIRPWNKPLD